MQAGLPQSRTSVSSSCATRAPEMLVAPSKHRFSPQVSSLIARIRSLSDAPKVSATKSIDQRLFGFGARRSFGFSETRWDRQVHFQPV